MLTGSHPSAHPINTISNPLLSKYQHIDQIDHQNSLPLSTVTVVLGEEPESKRSSIFTFPENSNRLGFSMCLIMVIER